MGPCDERNRNSCDLRVRHFATSRSTSSKEPLARLFADRDHRRMRELALDRNRVEALAHGIRAADALHAVGAFHRVGDHRWHRENAETRLATLREQGAVVELAD